MMDTTHLSRRKLLQATAGVVTSVVLPHTAANGKVPTSRPSKLNPSEVKTNMDGPVLSIPTTFKADFSVDHQGVSNMIRLGVKHGIPVFSMTCGNGMYSSLLYEEIKELTRTMVEAVGGKGVAIAAADNWWTGQVVDYARYAESVGADALQVMLPTGCSEAVCVEHFKTIASSTKLALVLQGDFSVSLLEKLVAIDSIVAHKEDVTLDYYIDRERKFGKRLVIFGGGTEYRFLAAQPYGAHCFYSAYATFAPQVSMRFWKAVRDNDIKTAVEMVNKYDQPFLERFSHAFWRATLEYFGIAKRYLRPPQQSFTDEQMRDVKTFYDSLGLHPSN